MQLDIDSYIHLLNDIDMSRERKVEMMEQVSLILQGFVDRAFGIDPVQTCLGINRRTRILARADALESDAAITPIFNNAAER
jgi:hypothetical protein